MAIMEKLSPQRLQQAAGRPLPQQDERPTGEPARHGNLPLEIRRKVDPHYSQWYVVPAREAQRRRPSEFLKFFRHTRRGWTETADPHLAQPGEEVIALERPRPKPRASGGGAPQGPRRITFNDWLAAASNYRGNVGNYLEVDADEAPDADLIVQVLPGTGEPHPYQLTLSGDGYRMVRPVNTEGRQEVRFMGLKRGGSYSLEVKDTAQAHSSLEELGYKLTGCTQSLFETAAYKALGTSAKLNGKAKVLHVLRQEMRGDTPVITVSPEPPQFGVFFDGTGNNLRNDLADPNDDRAPTNVAKLAKLYPRLNNGTVSNTYVEGVGTHAGQPDDNVDLATAYSFGRRVSRALTAARQFGTQFNSAQAIIVDVFGFSRGAAEARAFVNEVMRLHTVEPDYWGGAELKIRFLGLFDTVGSVGIPGDNDNDNATADRGLDGHIVLDLDPSSVDFAYQLTAEDEERKNFPLSSLRSGPSATLPTNFMEETLPGAHSDIGGGYGPGSHIVYFPTAVIQWMTDEELQTKLAALKADCERRYAEPGIDVDVTDRQPHETGDQWSPWNHSVVKPRWIRRVDPRLANYALERMHKEAVAHGVPFDPLSNLPSKSSGFTVDSYQVPDHMRKMITAAINQGRGSLAYRQLYAGYIHHSHQFAAPPTDSLLGTVVGNPYAPQEDAKHPAANGVREVFYNRPERGNGPDDHWRLRSSGHRPRRWQKQS